jgi:hypothetical protein
MRAVAAFLPAVLAGSLALPHPALADQSVASGSGKQFASARLDFRIVIPPVMVLSVDTEAVAAKSNGPSRVAGARALTGSGGVLGMRLQSNLRAVVLTQDPGRPAFLTASSP